MDWHIITSSKGGAGKTLISLMLTAYHAVTDHVLILDLNGMNADLSRLLAPDNRQKLSPDDYLFVNLGEDLGYFHFERVPFTPDVRLSYINGWPDDAFKTFNQETFGKLLLAIQKIFKPEKVQERFGFTIDTVIIDTNYHFCNIFSAKEEDYKKSPQKEFFDKENMFIWFIWVYRQLAGLIDVIENENSTNPHDVAFFRVSEVATTLQAKLKNPLGNPFIHLFGSVFIGQLLASKPPGVIKILTKWLRFTNDNNIEIKQLEKLSQLAEDGKITQASGFGKFVSDLKQAKERVSQEAERVSQEAEEDINLYFFNLLEAYVSSKDQCPKNILPLHLYQKDLLGYTEKDYEGVLLDQIYDLDIYLKSFQKTYGALLETKLETKKHRSVL
ncbi:MAG: hypothetical protein BWK78_03390 [Thiotrichaceae bacterium IS1]|nr:MAG: hypothetical protein BWK78_03390 [Thiotrichaceae bacterium IS1]